MRKYLRRLLRRLLLVTARLLPLDSPWERILVPVPAGVFGPGSRRQFAQYLEGRSAVPVETIDDIVDWLLGCEYATDAAQFSEQDVWQHPNSFEQTRRGDCEDFALWAWRKLSEIGIDAEFYVGRAIWGGEPGHGCQHAWVVYRVDGVAFLFEPAAKSREAMIRRLGDVMDQYVPHFAVTQGLRTVAFGGFLLDSRRARGNWWDLRLGPIQRFLDERQLTSGSGWGGPASADEAADQGQGAHGEFGPPARTEQQDAAV
jgi:hypothetical protein